MRKIAVLNQKGGVGKTTTVVNVAAAMAGHGFRVLVIDLDPQAHLTIHLGVDAEQPGCGAYQILSGQAGVHDAAVQVRSNLWLLGAGIELVGAETELVNEVGREIILRQAIAQVENDFDYLIIDCPPSLGLLTLNALAASEEVIIPVQPHFLALQGFSRLLQTIALVNSRINPALHVTAILMCMFDARTSLSAEVRQDIEKFLSGSRNQNSPWAGARIVPVHIRRNIKLAEAPSYGKTIFEYEPSCHGAADYLAVAEFVHTGKIEGRFDIQIDTASEPGKETAGNQPAADTTASAAPAVPASTDTPPVASDTSPVSENSVMETDHSNTPASPQHQEGN
ncbi:ParA family protein [Anaerohalosphaeraceae bacterium U12dextr]